MNEKIVRIVRKMYEKNVLIIESENVEMGKWMFEKTVRNVQKMSEMFVLMVENESVEMVK